MTEVMNAMDYDASALGNHEFDFGLDELRQRTEQANFPYLSANTRWKATGEVPTGLGVLPFSITEVNEVRIGIVGLTTTSTPWVTNPVYVADLSFINYETALRETIPLVEAQAPDLVFVIGHVCLDSIEQLAASVTDLGIAMMGAGHCNELTAKMIGETLILGGGYHFTSYATANFHYDLERERLLDLTYATHQHEGQSLAPDTRIESIVAGWRAQFETILGEVLAVSSRAISDEEEALRQAVVNSWLIAIPEADIALTNAGGLRSPLPAGNITFSDVNNLMPFDNTIITTRVSGKVVAQAIEEGRRPIVGGMQMRGNGWIFADSGLPLEADQEYVVALNSFMYNGGDNFGAIAEADANGRDTGINYRQPFVNWLQTAGNLNLP